MAEFKVLKIVQLKLWVFAQGWHDQWVFPFCILDAGYHFRSRMMTSQHMDTSHKVRISSMD